MSLFGHYVDGVKVYQFNGMPGWYSVPAGYDWDCKMDSGMQLWVSPNEITKNADGTVSGSPLYAAELNMDGTLVFQHQLASRKLNIDSPPHDRLSPQN